MPKYGEAAHFIYADEIRRDLVLFVVAVGVARFEASSTSVNSSTDVGADRFSAESHLALIHTQT